MSWTNEQVRVLINEYRKYPCLYAVKTKIFKNKHARANALDSIFKEVERVRPNVTFLEIKTKFNALKSNFMAEYKKVAASGRSGTGSDDIYLPTLWYYSLMTFVLEHNEPRLGMDSIDDIEEITVEINNDECSEQVLDENTEPLILDAESGNFVAMEDMASPSSSRTSSAGNSANIGKRRKTNSFSENSFLSNASNVIKDISNVISTRNKLQTGNSIFGEFVSSKLNQIVDEDIRLETELEITKILYDGIKRSKIAKK